MKLKTLVMVSVSISILATACKKDKETTPTTPTNNDSSKVAASPTAPMPTPAGNGISGALLSIRMKYSMQQTGLPMPVDVNSETALAVFYDAAGSSTMADAGDVSVNTYKLDKQTNNSYLKNANVGTTPKDLNFSSTSEWKVVGSGSVTGFTYNHNSSFPTYSPSLPASITKNSGLSLTFNSSTITNADSVYVVIAAGSKSITKSFSAKAGNVTISANEMQDLPVSNDNTAVLEVCPIDYMEGVVNGKNYIFMKELAVVRNITINKNIFLFSEAWSSLKFTGGFMKKAEPCLGLRLIFYSLMISSVLLS
jgi:hypothetical protein